MEEKLFYFSRTGPLYEGSTKPDADTKIDRFRFYIGGHGRRYEPLKKALRDTLAKHGIETAGDLAAWSENELAAIKGIGDATLSRLRKIVQSVGLSFREPEELPRVGTTVEGRLAARVIEVAKMAGESPTKVLSEAVQKHEEVILASMDDLLQELRQEKADALKAQAEELLARAEAVLAGKEVAA